MKFNIERLECISDDDIRNSEVIHELNSLLKQDVESLGFVQGPKVGRCSWGDWYKTIKIDTAQRNGYIDMDLTRYNFFSKISSISKGFKQKELRLYPEITIGKINSSEDDLWSILIYWRYAVK